ncbi:porin [soil metagenome]
MKNKADSRHEQSHRLASISAAAATLALALPWSAHAQGTVQITGILSTGPAYVDNIDGSSQGKLQNNLNWANWFGIRGTEDIGNGVLASFSLASNVNMKNGGAGQGNAFWNKNSWVGLGTRSLGSIQIGRNDEFAADTCIVSAMCVGGLVFNLHPGNLDRAGGGQLANMIKYVSPDFGSYRFRAYYAPGETGFTNNGRAVGVVGSYRSDAATVSASYESIKGVAFGPANVATGLGLFNFYGTPANAGSNFVLDEQQIMLIGARVPVNRFTLFAQASEVKLKSGANDDGLTTYELGGTYNFTDVLSATAAGSHSSFGTSKWDNYQLVASYGLSKRSSVFAGLAYLKVGGPNQRAQMFQVGGASSSQTQAAAAVGLRHNF